MLLVGAALAMLTGMVAVALSHLGLGPLAVTVASIIGCGYLLVFIRDWFNRSAER